MGIAWSNSFCVQFFSDIFFYLILSQYVISFLSLLLLPTSILSCSNSSVLRLSFCSTFSSAFSSFSLPFYFPSTRTSESFSSYLQDKLPLLCDAWEKVALFASLAWCCSALDLLEGIIAGEISDNPLSPGRTHVQWDCAGSQAAWSGPWGLLGMEPAYGDEIMQSPIARLWQKCTESELWVVCVCFFFLSQRLMDTVKFNLVLLEVEEGCALKLVWSALFPWQITDSFGSNVNAGTSQQSKKKFHLLLADSFLSL